jgi:hypothetical protein
MHDLELKRRNDLIDVAEEVMNITVTLNNLSAQAVDMFKVARTAHQLGKYPDADHFEKCAWDIIKDVENTTISLLADLETLDNHWKDN